MRGETSRRAAGDDRHEIVGLLLNCTATFLRITQ